MKDYLSSVNNYLTAFEYYEYISDKPYCLMYENYALIDLEDLGLIEELEKNSTAMEIFRNCMRYMYVHNIYGELHRVRY